MHNPSSNHALNAVGSRPDHEPDAEEIGTTMPSPIANRQSQGTLASILRQAPNLFSEVHHTPMPPLGSFTSPTSPPPATSVTAISTTKAAAAFSTSPETMVHGRGDLVGRASPSSCPDPSRFTSNIISTNDPISVIPSLADRPTVAAVSRATSTSSSHGPGSLPRPPNPIETVSAPTTSTTTAGRLSPLTSYWFDAPILQEGVMGKMMAVPGPGVATPRTRTDSSTFAFSAGSEGDTGTQNPSLKIHRPSGSFQSQTGSFQIHPRLKSQQTQPSPQNNSDGKAHNNPYRVSSFSSNCEFLPPIVPGYTFRGGSQVGNKGVMLGTKVSDGTEVSGEIHHSQMVIQHEHRILKRLQLTNAQYCTKTSPPAQPSLPTDMTSDSDVTMDTPATQPTLETSTSLKQELPEMEFVQGEKYFNRIVEDFIDLENSDMSILIMRSLGPDLLSTRLDWLNDLGKHGGRQYPDIPLEIVDGSPFSSVYVFLIFFLKAAYVLEELQNAKIAHLAICPTAIHWAPPETEARLAENQKISRVNGKNRDRDKSTAEDMEKNRDKDMDENGSSEDTERIADGQTRRWQEHDPNALYHDPSPPSDPSSSGAKSATRNWDINDTKLRLIDFTHSKILSHERARAPNNIVEWQIPGYMEYHLQYLAPEQTGRAETWVDHRTDIYCLGTTLFSLLTMQFPTRGTDNVQILQSILSKDLPPLQAFRPDVPQVIDDILRKMTQKQPSRRYQTAYGLKQDVLTCLSELWRTGTIKQFSLGSQDVSYQFILPSVVFGRQEEKQLISSAITQAVNAYNQTLHNDVGAPGADDRVVTVAPLDSTNDLDHYSFEDDALPLPNRPSTKIPLSSRYLLQTLKSFGDGTSTHRSSDTPEPVVRAIFVGGPSGVGKTTLVRGMGGFAKSSGLFAAGVFEPQNSRPYSAILACIQNILQQLLTQHTDALATLVVAIRTAFEPKSGISTLCDLIPELKYFYNGTPVPESTDAPLSNSAPRFHALFLKLVRVISTHFFMTWLIDDINHADENSIALLGTLVNAGSRLPIMLIIIHNSSEDCLVRVNQILDGQILQTEETEESMETKDEIYNKDVQSASNSDSASEELSPDEDPPICQQSGPTPKRAQQASSPKKKDPFSGDLPSVVRGGCGVRFIRLHNPTLNTIQEFLSVLLHRDESHVLPLANVLHKKTWFVIRQLLWELYQNQTIYFNHHTRSWDWESSAEILAQVVRKLTGEENAFLRKRFQKLDCDTKKILVCAAICGSQFNINDLQLLATTAYIWPDNFQKQAEATAPKDSGSNDTKAMAGLQSAIQEGILMYTSFPGLLRFQHSSMRKVALNLLEGTDEKERLHYEMAKILFNTPGQEFRTASHVLQCLELTQQKAVQNSEPKDRPSWVPVVENESVESIKLDIQALRVILTLAGEKSLKSGAQDMAVAYWRAALSLLPNSCWDLSTDTPGSTGDRNGAAAMDLDVGVMNTTAEEDIIMGDTSASQAARITSRRQDTKTELYREALNLHLQVIEAERWCQRFERALELCDVVLANVKDPVDRARIFVHKMEISVWIYNNMDEATKLALLCLHELGVSPTESFNPTPSEVSKLYEETYALLLKHLGNMSSKNPKICQDPRIDMITEVLFITTSTLYFNDIPFIAMGIALSVKLICKYGLTKYAGHALVCFALLHSTWHNCLDNTYEIGKLACKVSGENRDVIYLFNLSIQQWGEHVSNSLVAMEKELATTDLTCSRIFHVGRLLHVAVAHVLMGRVHLRDCMASVSDLINKHFKFDPKTYRYGIMQRLLELIKCLRGPVVTADGQTTLSIKEFIESEQMHKVLNVSAGAYTTNIYTLLKMMGAFMFGLHSYIDEITSSWHDEPFSAINFECSWIAHMALTIVGLSLATLLRTEKDPKARARMRRQLIGIRDKMEVRALKFPTNHAAMFYLIQAEISDQDDHEGNDMKRTLTLYESAISYSIKGDFPLFLCFSYEFAANYFMRHGLHSNAQCFMANACKGYQSWGARSKVSWLHKIYPDLLGPQKEMEQTTTSRGLFYRPAETEGKGNGAQPHHSTNRLHHNHHHSHHHSHSHSHSHNHPPPHPHSHSYQQYFPGPSSTGGMTSGGSTLFSGTSPWLASPSYSPIGFGHDAVSAAAAAMAESCMTSSSLQSSGHPSATSTSSGSGGAIGNNPTTAGGATGGATGGAGAGARSEGPLYSNLHTGWIGSPESPETDNADLDMLDFTSVIDAMQVIASEIDLDPLLVKSLGVLNQSVGAKRCYILISQNQEFVLAASQGDLGRCESVKPPMGIEQCSGLFHGVINYVINTSTPCLLTNARDDPRFSADEYVLQRAELRTVLCAPIIHKSAMVGVLYMEDFPERAFANRRMLVMNLLVQQLGMSITNALLYQSVLQSESKLNGLLENMPCGIALWDAMAIECLYINSSWESMTGFKYEEFMESGWKLLSHEDELDVYNKHWKERVAAGVPCQWETRYRLKDGSVRWAVVRMLPIYSSTEEKKVIQWLTVTIDIDDQRRAVQLKSNFLANMSHELRTPFSGILGMLSLLRDSSGLTDEQFEFVDMAKASCEMLIRIVDDLLNFSKLKADKVTLESLPLCFEEIVGDVCDLLIPLASKKGLELVILYDEGLPLVLIGDPDRLKQILMNLIGNAIKFSTHGNVVIDIWHELKKRETTQEPECNTASAIGANSRDSQTTNLLTLPQSSRATGQRKLSVSSSTSTKDGKPQGDEVTLHCAVRDSGIGLSPEEQDMLFVSFQQTDNGTTRKYGGTGLGLSICAELIAHMHGKIDVSSIKGQGSTFTFIAKLRTPGEDEEEHQNHPETLRIRECAKQLVIRLDMIRDRRILILSPNVQLREQIVRTMHTSKCIEYDSVTLAIKAGAIGLTLSADVPSTSASTNTSSSSNGNHSTLNGSSVSENDRLSSAMDLDSLEPFDIIIVDHVLDSADLDRIYPSPVVAFVLLLAPTTDTLRWILPPASKRVPQEMEEPESGQVDVGGRGRVAYSSEMDFMEKAMSSAEASTSLAVAAKGVTGVGARNRFYGNSSRRSSSFRPSQLFKKRKSRGYMTLNRPIPPLASAEPGAEPRMVTSSFQVCRMIKPVRRMKILQIMYNTFSQHGNPLIDIDTDTTTISELATDDDGRGLKRRRDRANMEGKGGESSGSEDASLSSEETPSSLRANARSPDSSRPGAPPTKRRKIQGSKGEIADGEDEESDSNTVGVRRRHRQGKLLGRSDPSDRADDDGAEADADVAAPSNPGRSSSIVNCALEGWRGTNNLDNKNISKRARNNDALTLLLTERERQSCHGKNVLVAEDDYVSQKILQKQLSKLGMNVKIANNGQEALEEWLASDQGYYTVAIFDHHMPIMDGLAATRKLRELEAERPNKSGGEPLSRIPIIGLSADIQSSTKELCIKAGMDEYLTKPLLTKGLALLIQRYCCKDQTDNGEE